MARQRLGQELLRQNWVTKLLVRKFLIPKNRIADFNPPHIRVPSSPSNTFHIRRNDRKHIAKCDMSVPKPTENAECRKL